MLLVISDSSYLHLLFSFFNLAKGLPTLDILKELTFTVFLLIFSIVFLFTNVCLPPSDHLFIHSASLGVWIALLVLKL